MTSQPNSPYVSSFSLFAQAASAAVVFVGCLALAGWMLDIPTLESVFPNLATMKANPALGLVAAGVSLWLVIERPPRRARLVAQVCALTVAMIGLLTLSEYLFSRSLGIDELLFRDEAVGSHPSGRPSPITAANLALVGVALLCLSMGTRRGQWLAQVPIYVVGWTSLLALVSYAYDFTALYAFNPFSSIALLTAFAFSMLCMGMLSARPDHGLMATITADSPGGLVARLLLPVAIVAPPIVGLVSVKARQAGLYETEFGISLLVVTIIAILAVAVSAIAKLLDRADAARRRAEAALRTSDAKFRGLLESAPDAVVIVDRDGRITLVNAQAEEMFGYSRNEILNRSVEMLLSQHSRQAHAGRRSDYSARPETRPMGITLDIVGRRKNGGEFPAEIELSPLETDEGLLITSVIRDVTERRRTDQALRLLNKELEAASRHKTEFLANLSHELRTPLNAILGASELMADGLFGPLNEKQLEYSHDIHQGGTHLLGLINDILDLAKIEAGRLDLHLSQFDLRSVMESSAAIVRERAARKSLELNVTPPPEEIIVEADQRKVKQIVYNLLTNAVKFTPEGGRVAFTAHRNGKEIIFAVEDTGPGVAQELRERVFEEFFQAPDSREGTGLGLALCRRLVELHGGRIWLETEGGQGSRFLFTIPITRIVEVA